MAHAGCRPNPRGRRGRRAVRPQPGRGGLARAAIRTQQVHRRQGRAALAGVPAAVRRPDADRAARGGNLEPVPSQAAGHRNPAALPDGVQRGPRPPAGRQGRRRGRRAAEDDDHQGQGQARRPADPDPRRAARPRRRRGGRGRRHRPGRRQAAESRDSRGGRIRAHRGEPARQQVGGRGPRHRYPARRPHRHGVHEHQRHPGHGRVRRDGDRDGDRGRAHLRDAAEPGGRQDPAHPPAGEAHPADPVHRRHRPGHISGAEPGARRDVHRGFQRGDRLRGLCDPDRAAGGGHDHPRQRDATARQGWRDHEAAAVYRDPGLNVGDQLGQDRDAHAEPDDSRGDDHRRPPVRRRRPGIRGRGTDHARGGPASGSAR